GGREGAMATRTTFWGTGLAAPLALGRPSRPSRVAGAARSAPVATPSDDKPARPSRSPWGLLGTPTRRSAAMVRVRTPLGVARLAGPLARPEGDRCRRGATGGGPLPLQK